MARKKAAAHHGGAWKVAYADFVTAMMALFMVLWISAQDQKILIATSRYFQNPFHSPMDATSGVLPFNSNKTTTSQGDSEGQEKEESNKKLIQTTFLNTVAADFYRLLNLDNDLANKPIDVQVTADGLRVTLFDRAKKPLFVGNTAEFTEWGRFVMQNISWTIDRHHFRVVIDGHTKANLHLGRADYSAWELSTDRANAARRSLVHYAVDANSIERVAGYGDTQPLDGERPDSDANQRVTLSLSLSARPHDEKSPSIEQAARAAQPAPASRTRFSKERNRSPSLRSVDSRPRCCRNSTATATAPRSALSAECGAGTPTVEVIKEGDKVVRLVVVCTCGERVEIDCLYPGG